MPWSNSVGLPPLPCPFLKNCVCNYICFGPWPGCPAYLFPIMLAPLCCSRVLAPPMPGKLMFRVWLLSEWLPTLVSRKSSYYWVMNFEEYLFRPPTCLNCCMLGSFTIRSWLLSPPWRDWCIECLWPWRYWALCSRTAFRRPYRFFGLKCFLNVLWVNILPASTATSSWVWKCLHGGTRVHFGHRLLKIKSPCKFTAELLRLSNRLFSSNSHICSFVTSSPFLTSLRSSSSKRIEAAAMVPCLSSPMTLSKETILA